MYEALLASLGQKGDKAVIDEINQERIDVGVMLNNPVYTGDTSVYTLPAQEEEEIEVSIIIR